MSLYDTGLVWFRRDLRCNDHAALAAALAECRRVYCAFVYDRAILDELHAEGVTADRRVEFIHRAARELAAELQCCGGGLIERHAVAETDVPALARELDVDAVYANGDYEPAALVRDRAVARALASEGRRLKLFKDHVIFERDELLTGGGTPFSVYTPYRTAWMKRLTARDVAECSTTGHAGHLAPPPVPQPQPDLATLGFAPTNLADIQLPTGASGAHALLSDFATRIGRYRDARDQPAVRGPSYLSVHLRFGTVSIRELVRFALGVADSDGAQAWLAELVWREFYQMILWHHPHVVTRAYRPEYDRIVWDSGEAAEANFRAWCIGATGYPLVDAGMRQLNQTGYMHNRLRMVTASFLTKDLGIDWRRGERYFARQLNDYELGSNNGGWQWAASTGCDAQPYFRIFNPVTQSRRFDANGAFIRRYVPEVARFEDRRIHAPWEASPEEQRSAGCLMGRDYPAPIVDHAEARQRTLARYSVVRR